jgi:diaminopimelate epimerase
MKVPFTKMHAAGNDFILIDNLHATLKPLSKRVRRHLCARKTGIGADGILLLEKDPYYPFRMRYFNADGGEASLCGNGARCAALYAFTRSLVPRTFTFRSSSGIHTTTIYKNGSIKIALPPCVFGQPGYLSVSGKRSPYVHITVGVPHIIIFVADPARIAVPMVGSRLRHLKRFKPHGVNVDFAAVTGKNRMFIRTYERGVEDETLACGTGVAAAAAAAFRKKHISSPVKVKTASGEQITVQFIESGDKLLPQLIGKAHFVFAGATTIP